MQPVRHLAPAGKPLPVTLAPHVLAALLISLIPTLLKTETILDLKPHTPSPVNPPTLPSSKQRGVGLGLQLPSPLPTESLVSSHPL